MSKLKVEVDDADFLEKTVKEQNLLMFKKMCSIDQEGCSWAKKTLASKMKKLYVIGAGAGFAGGFSAIMAKAAFWK